MTVTEMLPDLGQLWLTDRQGRRYSSELRIIAYDGMTEDNRQPQPSPPSPSMASWARISSASGAPMAP